MSTNNTNILLTSKCTEHDTPTSTNIMVKLLTLLVNQQGNLLINNHVAAGRYTMRGNVCMLGMYVRYVCYVCMLGMYVRHVC